MGDVNARPESSKTSINSDLCTPSFAGLFSVQFDQTNRDAGAPERPAVLALPILAQPFRRSRAPERRNGKRSGERHAFAGTASRVTERQAVPALEGSSLRRLSQDSEGYVKTGRVVKEIKDQLIKP
jgi:hypothetical protein